MLAYQRALDQGEAQVKLGIQEGKGPFVQGKIKEFSWEKVTSSGGQSFLCQRAQLKNTLKSVSVTKEEGPRPQTGVHMRIGLGPAATSTFQQGPKDLGKPAPVDMDRLEHGPVASTVELPDLSALTAVVIRRERASPREDIFGPSSSRADRGYGRN